MQYVAQLLVYILRNLLKLPTATSHFYFSQTILHYLDTRSDSVDANPTFTVNLAPQFLLSHLVPVTEKTLPLAVALYGSFTPL